MTTAISLDALAGQIRTEHEQVGTALRRALDHALRAGDLLIEAKATVGHGAWLPWLADHCDLSERVAQQYMRLARHREQVEQANPNRDSDLSVRGALALLVEPSHPTAAAAPSSSPPASELLINHPDWTPEYAVSVALAAEALCAVVDSEMRMARAVHDDIAAGGTLRGMRATLAAAGIMPEHDPSDYLAHWTRCGSAYLAGEPVPLMDDEDEDEVPGGGP